MNATAKVLSTPVPATAPIATLFYFEFCQNNLGVWDREWFLTREEAETARENRADSIGTDLDETDDEDLCGEYGDISEVQEEQVPLTTAGLLAFANNFAVDSDAG
jgi:hypothetical protein